jgi:hypothetical protein
MHKGKEIPLPYEPTDSDWAIADQLWVLLENMDRRKARTIVTSLITCSATAAEAAANIVREEQGRA